VSVRPLFRNPDTATLAGLALWAAGLYCLWDAYGGRGRKTPFGLRVFQGVAGAAAP
jgi:hypothetical protein